MLRIKLNVCIYVWKVNEGEYRAGFRRNSSDIDQIFSLKKIQAKGYEYKIVIFVVFVDFKQV